MTKICQVIVLNSLFSGKCKSCVLTFIFIIIIIIIIGFIVIVAIATLDSAG